ncbi:MAG: hypothetical protein PHT36_01555, partial [Patescibacteria group bacterium]|nr:hypothetical protein [Patescibacteria group bacterium]
MLMLLLAKKTLDAWGIQRLTQNNVGDMSSWIYIVVFGVLIFMAATIPLKMGNEIYDKALGYGKKGLGFAAKKTGLASMWADRKASVAQREKERGANLRSQIALSGKGTDSFWRRTVAGVDERQAKAMDSARINDMVSRMEEEDITKDVARSRYLQAEGDERRALARLQAKNGWFDDGNEAAIERFAEDFSKDAYIRNTAPKEQGDLLSAAELAGYGDYGTDDVKIGQVSSVLRGKAYSGVTDLKLSQITQMMKPENKHEMIGLLSNGQKMKKAQETWDDQRMAALGRAYRSLSMQERSTIMSSPDMTDEHRAVIERAVRLDSERTEAARGGAKGMNSVHQVKKKGTEQKVDIIDTQEPPRPTHPPGTGGGQPPADGTPPTSPTPPAGNL